MANAIRWMESEECNIIIAILWMQHNESNMMNARYWILCDKYNGVHMHLSV